MFKGYRTYISATGAILVSIGAVWAAIDMNDYGAAFTAASTGLIALAQIFQRASNITDVLPNNAKG